MNKNTKYFLAFILTLVLSFNLISSYKIADYTKVTSIFGKVSISSQNMIMKPAKIEDLLFIKDNIKTGASSYLTGYLENNNVFKIMSNTSLTIQDSFDKSKRMHFYIEEGTFLIASSMKSKPDSLTVGTPNASISLNGGAALISYYKGITKVDFITGSGVVNGETIPELMEAIVNKELSIIPLKFSRVLQDITKIPDIEKIDAGDIPENIYKIQLSSLNDMPMIQEEDPTESQYMPVNNSTLVITNNI